MLLGFGLYPFGTGLGSIRPPRPKATACSKLSGAWCPSRVVVVGISRSGSRVSLERLWGVVWTEWDSCSKRKTNNYAVLVKLDALSLR